MQVVLQDSHRLRIQRRVCQQLGQVHWRVFLVRRYANWQRNKLLADNIPNNRSRCSPPYTELIALPVPCSRL